MEATNRLAGGMDDAGDELAAALDMLVVALVHRGDLDGAIVHARRRSALDPLHEPTHRRLMLMHAWAGQRHAAVRQYRECVTVLDRELGVAPLPDTTDLHDAILAGTAPPRPVAGAPTVGTAPVAGEVDRAVGRERREVRPPLPMWAGTTCWPTSSRRALPGRSDASSSWRGRPASGVPACWLRSPTDGGSHGRVRALPPR